MPLELKDSVPAEYEERMLAASLDCVDGRRGDPTACHAVGEYLAVIKKDYKKAREAYQKNCDERGNGPSCFNLGRLLLGGKGGETDEIAASRRFSQACAFNHGPGCHHFGLLSMKRGDRSSSKKALTKACDLRDAESCYIVGSNFLRKPKEDLSFLQRIRLPKRDVLKAKQCLEVACDEGHAPACHNIAVMFKHGDDGVPADPDKHQLYKKRTEDLIKAAGALQGIRVA